jgi:predicted DNA-binding protein
VYDILKSKKGVISMPKRMNFYLAEIQIKRLQSMSKKTGLSASEILRRAIDEYWEKFEKKEKRK